MAAEPETAEYVDCIHGWEERDDASESCTFSFWIILGPQTMG